VRPLLLGMGWPSEQPGGLNRYFEALFHALERAGAAPRAVVAGPADENLVRRIRSFARAARGPGDVVDAHFALYALLPVVFGSLRDRPLVVHFHGPWADESLAAGERSRLRLRAKRAVERAVYRRAAEVVVLSRSFRRVLVERYGVSPWRISVVPPGVDLDRFSPGDRAAARSRLGVPADARVAVAVRRLVPRMGLDVLLEAWADLPGDRGVLLVVGDGPERLGLEERAAELGIAGSVRFLGRVSDDELVECYRAADVCIVPSLALEGFGLVTLEALACGTPVVVSDAGGLPEAVAGLDPTLVVPAGDPGALAARLHGPLPDRDACRAYAEGFSWDRVAARHLELYGRAAQPRPAERLRVLYLDHTARLSGGELALLRLLPALDEIDPHVVLAEDGPLVQRLEAAGVSVEVLPMAESARGLRRGQVGLGTLLSPQALRTAGYALRLARRLRRFRPDLVHTNSLKAALYGGVAGRLARVPVVWHVRDRIADDYLPALTVRIVRAAAKRLPWIVIANSQTTLETLGVAGFVVPSPVEPMPPRPDRSGPLLVGIVGRIAPWKGQHLFVQAFADAFPGGPEQAVVVGEPIFGDDEETYFEDLRRLGTTLGLDGRLELAGYREDVAAELGRLDVLVHASVLPEPFGQVVAEGLAAGLPVVAAAAGGPAELIEDDVTGLLYPPGDAGALAECLRRLAADPELRVRLGRAGRERVAALSPERVAAQVTAVYRQALVRR
jgi:glycosyltransferase involved in cell wall biosynthesis